MTERAENWTGMNWIRQEKRLAIYLRDGLSCAWCGFAVEDGAQLTLDHLKPDSKGGTNEETNLVTACKRCNDSRGNRAQTTFSRAVAAYVNHKVTPEEILAHVKACARRSLSPFKAEAKMMVERRGSVAKALAAAHRSTR